MKKKNMEKVRNIVQAEMKKNMYKQCQQLEENGKNMNLFRLQLENVNQQIGYLQYQIDLIQGADPIFLQTPARHDWKTKMTARVTAIRKVHPDINVQANYRKIFGLLYGTMQRDYGIDLNFQKKRYMEENNIPSGAFHNVRTLNVVYYYPELQEKFEETVRKYEKWYLK